MRRRTALAGGLALIAGGGLAAAEFLADADDAEALKPVPPGEALTTIRARYRFTDLAGPAGTAVADQAGRTVAQLTIGARTMLLAGRRRTFTEPNTTPAKVDTDWWVRVAPAAYEPGQLDSDPFAAWFLEQLASPEDDVLAAATQYVTGAPERRDSKGVHYAGDAHFGYINTPDERDGADFYDFLGISWRWPDGTVSRPATKWKRSLDCSGYLRLVYGYRMGVPLFHGTGHVAGLPRRAAAMADHAPSVLIASTPKPDQPPDDVSRIRPGDLVFFALHLDKDPTQITHSGIVLGRDDHGATRFISARQSVNGPSFGDVGGAGVLESGYFRDRLRRAIRL